MKSLWNCIGLGVLLLSIPAIAGINPAPTVASVDFQSVQTASDLKVIAAVSPWLQDIRQADGTFDPACGAWIAADTLPFGQGSLILDLNRETIPADLALTLIYEETTNGDFVVQLCDAQHQILAADLFSNIIVAGREAKTDTFILDLAHYPTATQVILRRLKGEIRIYGFILSPVACEVPLEGCDAFELAVQLDQRITSESDLVQAAAQIVQPQGRTVDWTQRTVQKPLDVAARNPYAQEAFAADDYPVYTPTASILDGDMELQFTASSLYAVLGMLRLLNAYHPQAQYTAIHSMSSYQALQPFLAGQTKICMMSIPMSLADREQFFRDRGYPVMELPAALDPILVIVNKNNPISELTIPQLDAIFGTELRAGAERRIQTWGDLGLEGEWTDRPIALWGGSLHTGTSRLFQQLALQGGPFDPDLQNDSYSMYLGVMYAVVGDPAAIGYLNAQNSSFDVKTLALAPQTGLPAYSPTPKDVYTDLYPLTRTLYLYVDAASPDQIDLLTRELLNLLYSRSGQELFARSMQAPLPAGQVRTIRKRLGF